MALPEVTQTNTFCEEIPKDQQEIVPGLDIVLLESEQERVRLRTIGSSLVSDFKDKSLKEVPITVLRAGHLATAAFIGGVRVTNAFIMSANLAVIDAANDLPLHQELGPVVACGSVWGANYIWSSYDAAAFNGLIDHLPKTFDSLSRFKPIRKVINSVPGIDVSSKEQFIEDARNRGLGQNALTLTQKAKFEAKEEASIALELQGPGIIGFVLAGGCKGMDKPERQELRRKLSRANSSFLALIALAIDSSIEIAGPHNSFGDELSNLSGNRLFWLGVAFGAKPAYKRLVQPVLSKLKHSVSTSLNHTRFARATYNKPLALPATNDVS